MLLMLLSIITDITTLGLHGKDWSDYGRETAFGMYCLIMCMPVKLVAIFAQFHLLREWGTDSSGGRPVPLAHAACVLT
jgi:hypothetical protein